MRLWVRSVFLSFLFFNSACSFRAGEKQGEFTQQSFAPLAGAFDLSFGDNGDFRIFTPAFGGYGQPLEMAVDPQGRIYTIECNIAGGAQSLGLVRRLSSGEIDTEFAGTGSVFFTQECSTNPQYVKLLIRPDGRPVAIINKEIYQYKLSGSLDSAFSGDGRVSFANPAFYGPLSPLYSTLDAALDSRGNLFVVVSSIAPNGGTYGDIMFTVVKIRSNGSLDSQNFGQGGWKIINNIFPSLGYDVARSIFVQSDGSIYIAGNLFNISGGGAGFAVRLLPNGELDNGFGQNGVVVRTDDGYIPDGYNEFLDIIVSRENIIYVGGYSKSLETEQTFGMVWAFDQKGQLNESFNQTGIAVFEQAEVRGLVEANPNEIYMIAWNAATTLVNRILPDGRIDTSFAPDFVGNFRDDRSFAAFNSRFFSFDHFNHAMYYGGGGYDAQSAFGIIVKVK